MKKGSKMKHKTRKKVNMKFIPDEEINLLEKDLLGTLPYAETLNNIIQTCNPPFTIGLLGGWGSGKSSIVKTLQEKFNNDQESKIKVFIYDAWKYSKDSFRRTFVLELKRFFKMGISEELESFYKDKHEEISGKVGLIKGWWVYLITLLLPLIAINIKPFFIEKTFELTTFTISLLFSALTTFIAKTFIQYKISIIKPKTFAPEQFEEIFREIVKKLTSKKSIGKWISSILNKDNTLEKVVIVIDNIDRCHKELATELLLNIKNFLEIKNVVFIVPVDEKGLKKYLELENQDANEFLRKLFNITIRIKKFTGIDLFDFAKKLKEKYKLDFNDDVLSIVSQEFAKNPRRIIQFLNNIQSETILAKKAEEHKLIKPEGVITSNLPMIAKLLIIKEEWQELYTSISENPNLLNRINEAFREKQFKRENGGYKFVLDDIHFTPEQYRFLFRTSNISVNQIEPFVVNRDVFRDLPDEINSLVLSQDWETIKEKYIKTEYASLLRTIEFISRKLDVDLLERELYQTSGFNLLSLVFKIANDEEFSSEFKELYDTLAFQSVITVCGMGEVENLIFDFNPGELVKFSRWIYDKGNKGLINNIIKAINSEKTENDKNEIETIKTFIERYADKPEQLNKIKDKFSRILINNPVILNDFKEILEDSISKYLINDYLMKNFVDTLQANSNQNNTLEKVNTLNNLCTNEIMPREMVISYMEKAIYFANTDDLNIMNFWFNTLKITFNTLKNNSPGEINRKIYELLNNRYQWLYNQYDAGQIQEASIECYKHYLNLCLLLYLSTDQYVAQIMQWMNSFFWKDNSVEIYIYINELFLIIVNIIEVHNWPFSQYIIKRFDTIECTKKKKFAITLNKMLLKTNNEKGLNTEEINAILTYYLDIAKSTDGEQSEEAKNWLKEIIKNKYVIERLIIKIDSINNPKELSNLFVVIIALKNNKLLKQVITKIVIQTPCENIEKVIVYLSSNKKVKIEMIKESIQKKIDQLNIENDNQHRDCLGRIMNIKNIMDGKLSEKVIDKLRPLLASNDKEKQIFSLKCLGNLQEIPDSKRKLLKALVKEIKSDGWLDEGKEFLKNIKGRIK